MDTKLTTIVCSDVIGYSTLMQQDESTTLAKLDKCKSIIEPLIDSSKGRLFNTGGDSLLIEFSSAVDAVRFGIQMQDSLYKLNNNMNWRIGIHAGEVWIYGTNLMGDAVNLAARTESLADYKGVTMTDTVYKLVSPKIKDYKFISRGLQQFKNVEPMEIWSVVLPYSQPNPNLNRAIFKEPTQKKSHSELISAVLNDQAARNLSVTNAIAFKHDNRFGPATRILMFRALKHDTKAIEELVNFMEKDIIPKDLLAYVYAVLREIHHKVESNLALRIVDLVKDVSHSLSMQYLRHAAKVNEQANQRLAVAVFNNPYSSPAEIEEIVSDLKDSAMKRDVVSMLSLGKYYLQLRDKQNAFKWLYAARSEHNKEAQSLLEDLVKTISKADFNNYKTNAEALIDEIKFIDETRMRN